MKPWQRYGIAALAGILLGLFLYYQFDSDPQPEVRIETVVKTDTIVKTVVDSIPFTPISEDNVKVEDSIPIIEKDGTIIKTKKYTGKKIFEDSGAELEYEIYADSLHGTAFNLKVKEKIVTNTVTTTIEKTLPPKSALFVGGGADFGQGLQSVEVGIMYNRRQKWQAGIVVNHDLTGVLPPNMRTTVGGRVYIKL